MLKKRTVCTYVRDGDTFLTAGRIWIRLAGVCCPELGEWGSKKATSILAKLILGKAITYKPVGTSYHRIVASVWVGQRNVNNYMRRLGYT